MGIPVEQVTEDERAAAARINWLRTRFRRQFPYERDTRWSQSPDEKRRWTEALEAEGVPAVRRALERSRAGPPGLIRIGQSWVAQGFAGEWHDSHKINWSKWGVGLALVVALAGLVQWPVG
jgi:hypothetical protein